MLIFLSQLTTLPNGRITFLSLATAIANVPSCFISLTIPPVVPQVTAVATTIAVFKGERVVLSCSVTGASESDIVWYYNGQVPPSILSLPPPAPHFPPSPLSSSLSPLFLPLSCTHFWKPYIHTTHQSVNYLIKTFLLLVLHTDGNRWRPVARQWVPVDQSDDSRGCGTVHMCLLQHGRQWECHHFCHLPRWVPLSLCCHLLCV